jgi:hypothetical protein
MKTHISKEKIEDIKKKHSVKIKAAEDGKIIKK